MLVISRRMRESITLEPVEGLDPSTILLEAFDSGPIRINLLSSSGSRVKLAIEAPAQLHIRRGAGKHMDNVVVDLEPVSEPASKRHIS